MKRPGSRIAIIAVLAVGVVVFILFIYAWNTILDIFQPATTNNAGNVSVTVQSGETATQIGDDLQNRGIIRNATAFKLWARIKGLDSTLEAGKYDNINPRMTISEIVDQLQKGQPDEILVTIPEGSRIRQMAIIGANANLPKFSSADFLKYAGNINNFPDSKNYSFLFKSVPSGSSMEGLLFPDTYYMPTNGTARDLINKMLTEMTTKIKDNHLDEYAAQNKMTVYQMLTLASIVQREASGKADMGGIARVYWNRLYTDAGLNETGGGLLQADPTVQYARDSQEHPAKYWTPLADAGTKIATDSPWNTYEVKGFPPTPISSPSLAVMQASANPPKSDALYFFAGNDHQTHFDATKNQFEADKTRYGVNN